MRIRKKMWSVTSLILAFVMLMNLTPIVYAAEVNAVSVEHDEQNGTIRVDVENAAEGDLVTVFVEAKEGYVLTQVAYREVSEDGTVGKTKEISKNEDGEYTFTMPASSVEVGAAFQPENSAVLYGSSNSEGGKIGGSKETDYSIYISNWDVYLNVGDKDAKVYLTFDKRFLDIEGVSMNLEIRQYNDDGYKFVGKSSYDKEALGELVSNAEDDGKAYIIESIEIPVAEGKDYEEGMYQYCVVQFSCPTWVDAFGNELYRWTYTGVDATVLGAGVKAPSPIVWLYNLDENSYRGSVVRKILADLGVKAGTINHENLNQNIGYLVEWEGYEPVENPYSSEEYDVEYMLMGNMSDVQLDLLLEAMDENNIFVDLKSIPTAWTASKTFAELFDIMAEENEVMQEAVALDKMIYAAEQLDEATYGNSEYWEELQKELQEALIALSTDAEESPEGADLYRNARLELERVYLLVTGKQVLDGELEILLEKQSDGNYKVTAQLHSTIENHSFSYNWEPASSAEEAAADYLIVKESDLYKVSLDITGTQQSYGTMSATFYVPDQPEYEISATQNSIRVELKEQGEKLNMPVVQGYVAEIYLGEELVASEQILVNDESISSRHKADATEIVFENLSEGTEYTLKLNAFNVIGRSDIVEDTVATLDKEDTVLPDEDESKEEDNEQTGSDEDKVEEGEKPEVDVENTGKPEEDKTNEETVKTGDESQVLIWGIILMISLGLTGCLIVNKKVWK